MSIYKNDFEDYVASVFEGVRLQIEAYDTKLNDFGVLYCDHPYPDRFYFLNIFDNGVFLAPFHSKDFKNLSAIDYYHVITTYRNMLYTIYWDVYDSRLKFHSSESLDDKVYVFPDGSHLDDGFIGRDKPSR